MRESSERAMEGSARGDGGQPVDPAANGVSKHPVASIPTTDLSFADIERSRSHPVRWACYIVAVLAAIIAPYWLGRMIAVEHTAWLVSHLSAFEPRGVALVSWAVTVLALAGLGMIIVESHNWLGRIIFFLGLVAEQFIAGLCLLRFDFWYATYVVYGDDAAVERADAQLGLVHPVLRDRGDRAAGGAVRRSADGGVSWSHPPVY